MIRRGFDLKSFCCILGFASRLRLRAATAKVKVLATVSLIEGRQSIAGWRSRNKWGLPKEICRHADLRDAKTVSPHIVSCCQPCAVKHWQHNQHLNRLLVQQTLQIHEGFRRKGHVMFLEKLLKLLLEWLRFHITTFSLLHIFFWLNFFFESKTCSLTCYFGFVAVLKKLFCYFWPNHWDLDVALCFRQYFLLVFFDFVSKELEAVHVCCLHLKRWFQCILNPSADPWRHPLLLPITPTARVIQRLLFFPVFAWCAQSDTVTARRGPAGSDHTEPHIVLIQLPTPRLDNSPWREAPEKRIRPLVLTFFPIHLPPGQERPRLSQLSSQPSPRSAGSILLASILQQDVDYLPAVRFTSLKPVLERTATCDRSQSWGRSPEDVQTARSRRPQRLSAAAGINPSPSEQIP